MRTILFTAFAVVLLALPSPGFGAETGNSGGNVASGAVVSLPPERVALSTGEIRKFELPFVVESVRSSTEHVRVSRREGQSIELEAVSAGSAVVTVVSGELRKEFQVTVSSSIMPVLPGAQPGAGGSAGSRGGARRQSPHAARRDHENRALGVFPEGGETV